jgi:hypothetical protein
LRTFPDDDIHVLRDSREFLGVTFTPLWKDTEWYLAPRAFEPVTDGRWWLHCDSPKNGRFSAINLRYAEMAEGSCWRLAETPAERRIKK